MKKYILRRFFWGVVVVWIVSLLVFSATRVGPDPVLMMAAPDASEADLQALRIRFGLDKPLVVQYLIFVSRALRGDFGESTNFGLPASELIISHFPASLELVITAKILALGIGILAGMLAVRRRGRWMDNSLRAFSLLGLSLPSFWIGMLAILVFSFYLKILPTSGTGGPAHLLMPACTLAWHFSAGYMRLTHSSLLEVMNREYVKLARLKGLPEIRVLTKHALRNALIPIVTFAGMNVVLMFSASVAIETVFAWPGLGFLLYQAALNRDFNVVQGVVLIISIMMVFLSLLVDILYAYLDPRIRYT